MNAPDIPERRRRRAKWIAASLLISLLVLGGLWWCFNPWSLSRQLAALRSQGLPTNADELNDYYAVPDGVTDTTALWLAAIQAAEAADLYNNGNALPIVGANPADVPPAGEHWVELEAARTFLQTHNPELELAWKAAAAGGAARFPQFDAGGVTGLPSLNARQAARLLELHAHVMAHQGRHVDSLRDVRAIFALSEALRREPLQLLFLVRLAYHALGCSLTQELVSHSTWNDSEIAELQTLIAAGDFKVEMIRALHGERAQSLSMIDNAGFGPLTNFQKSAALEVYQEAIEGMALDWPGALQEQAAVAARLGARKGITGWRYFVIQLVGPSLEEGSHAGARATARQRALVALLAARRFQIKNGRLPDSIKEIGPENFGTHDVPADQLTDPFDGQPLRFLKKEGRIAIYSLGENGVDDGGQITSINQKPPLDAGFELR